jgi:glutamine synthetase
MADPTTTLLRADEQTVEWSSALNNDPRWNGARRSVNVSVDQKEGESPAPSSGHEWRGQPIHPGVRTSRAPAPTDPERAIEHWASKGVRFAAISFADMHGRAKAKVVPLSHLHVAAKGSELYTGAALDGVPQQVNDNEISTIPDLANGMIMPWQPDTVWFPSDLELDGAPFTSCSRQILNRVAGQATSMGMVFQLGIETEFFVLKDSPDGPVPTADDDDLDKPAYDLRTLLRNFPMVTELVDAMNNLGWDVYSFDHEDANGQFETDFSYTDAITMADRFTFFRLMVGEFAHRRGFYASFMPKPFGNRTGSGAHMNMSLSDEQGSNLFMDDADSRGCGLSTLGYQFIAGVLNHAAAITAVIAPTVNSYKRLTKHNATSGYTWAPIFGCYGGNNRTNMLRIPGDGGRVECRAADASMNLYLAAAMMLAAGLEGVREQLDPGEPNRENMYLFDPDELRRRGIEQLPRTLHDAVVALEVDPLARSVFGDTMLDAFVEYKAGEWDEYHGHVSDWERARYLKFF